MRPLLLLGSVILPTVFGCNPADSARHRAVDLNNLHNLGIAVHNDASVNRSLLLRGTLNDDDGTPLHGWNAQLLPHVDRQALSRQIDFEKSWSDPVNAEPMKVALPVFLYPSLPTHDERGFALTTYAANQHVVGDHDPLTVDEIAQADGISSTLLIGAVGGDPHPWGHPLNWRDPANGLGPRGDQFGSPTGSTSVGVHFLFTDGAAKAINPDIDPAVLKALGTPNGGEELPEEFRSNW